MQTRKANRLWNLAPFKRPIPARLSLAMSVLALLVASVSVLLVCDLFKLQA